MTSLAKGIYNKLTLQHEKERDDNYLKFREEEARKTREHEYRMTCLFRRLGSQE